MYHIPIMVNEIIDALKIESDGIYLDGTIGGGGHSEQILLKGGRVYGIDRDIDAINECEKRLKQFGDKLTLRKENFKNVSAYLSELNEPLSGALLDLGISSHQIDEGERGMSYIQDAPLDMRMDKAQFLNARMVINDYSEDELTRILFEYGEERHAKRIVRAIVEQRKHKSIDTTGELAALVRKNIGKITEPHPEKRVFMAVRIEVNNELRGLDAAVNEIFSHLKSGARMCVMSFHSLEDRIIKQAFARLCQNCICDKSLPKCVCGNKAKAKQIARIRPSEQEIMANSRSKPATLRIIERI